MTELNELKKALEDAQRDFTHKLMEECLDKRRNWNSDLERNYTQQFTKIYEEIRNDRENMGRI